MRNVTLVNIVPTTSTIRGTGIMTIITIILIRIIAREWTLANKRAACASDEKEEYFRSLARNL